MSAYFLKKKNWDKLVEDTSKRIRILTEIVEKDPEAIASVQEKDQMEKKLEYLKTVEPKFEVDSF